MINTRIGRIRDPVERFFAYAVEREAIRIRREVKQQPAPYTDDPILQKYRFCNVHREDDRTTRWFKKYVREPLRDKPEVLLATVLFRWFNRITTGEAIFCQESLYFDGPGTAWEEYLRCSKTSVLLQAVRQVCGKGPYVTGSYTVLGRRWMPKLQGCLWGVDQFNKGKRVLDDMENAVTWRRVSERLLEGDAHQSLQFIWSWLRQFDYIGDFVAYEIVTDLRHTALLENASDVLTWANPGPGAKRGINRLHNRDVKSSIAREDQIEGMVHYLGMANDEGYWPRKVEGVVVPRWEMREVEHSLCEFDKMERVRLGQGKPRGVFT